jgi:endoplasmic reticulum chaperone BiP
MSDWFALDDDCVYVCLQEDKKVKDRIDSRNSLESYCYNLKNSLEDSEKGLADKMGADDKEAVEKAVQDALDWIDENQEAEAEDFKAKLKELEKVVNPIMQKVYQASGGAPGGAPGGDDEDFGHDDL